MKNIGILGTGVVGQTVGKKLVQLGYNVTLGSRSANNEKANQWVNDVGGNAKAGTFEDAARYADAVFVCTNGAGTVDAVKQAGAENLKGKLVIDVTNPLDFSNGMPPSLLKDFSNTFSLGEAVQQTAPEAKVVKTLNIVNCEVMVEPTKSGGQPTMLMCGNDAGAKADTVKLLNQFGWNDVLDLGDIKGSRAMEAYVTLWVRVYMITGNGYNAMRAIR